MKCIIAGGRSYKFNAQDIWEIDRLHQMYHFTDIVSGHCLPTYPATHSADMEGEEWAKWHSIPITPFPADWNIGRQAGPLRNREMAEYVGPEGCCILFPGGKGTQSMFTEANRVGMMIFDFRRPV